MASAEVRLRPLTGWPHPKTERRKPQSFRAKWADTKALLAKEAEMLDADLVVVEFDVVGGEAAFRVDGSLRANTRPGDFPGVRVTLDSRHGPLAYATDRYYSAWAGQMPDWQANARAIALSLQALRAVDRYGVTRSGEQYTGWRAIEAGANGGSRFTTADEAARWMHDQLIRTGAVGPAAAGEILRQPRFPASAYKLLVRRMHPDVGGDPAEWARLDEAWQLVGAP